MKCVHRPPNDYDGRSPYYTAKQAARILGITANALRIRINRKKINLKKYYHKGAVVILKKDFDEFMDKREINV